MTRVPDGSPNLHDGPLSQQAPSICPLSVFEMQFYNGDFLLSNQHPQNRVSYPTTHHPQFVSSFQPQQPNALKASGSNGNLHASPGLSQTQKQNPTHA